MSKQLNSGVWQKDGLKGYLLPNQDHDFGRVTWLWRLQRGQLHFLELHIFILFRPGPYLIFLITSSFPASSFEQKIRSEKLNQTDTLDQQTNSQTQKKKKRKIPKKPPQRKESKAIFNLHSSRGQVMLRAFGFLNTQLVVSTQTQTQRCQTGSQLSAQAPIDPIYFLFLFLFVFSLSCVQFCQTPVFILGASNLWRGGNEGHHTLNYLTYTTECNRVTTHWL